MRRRKYMGKPAKIFIVLLGIMLLFTVISRSAASFTVAQVRVEQPQARKIEHKVTGDGTVEKLLDQAVYAPADILVAKVNVRKGQNVKKGQTLAVLDMDSLKDKIRTISDDIEILQLQNDALLSAEAKKNSDRNQAVARAKEDYRDTVRNNADAVRDAKKDVKDTKTRLRREQARAYEKKLEELQTAAKEAKKTYDDAIEQQKTEEQQARRAVEDAAKTPVSDYSDTITQIEIDQKQRKLDAAQKKLDALTKQKDGIQKSMDRLNAQKAQLEKAFAQEKDEAQKQNLKTGIASLESQISALTAQRDSCTDQWENQCDTVLDLKDELATEKLRQQAKKNEASRQEADRRQTLARAQEDYENVVGKNERLVSEAKQKWKESQCTLQAFVQGEDEEPQDTSAAENAKKAVKTAQKQQKQQNKEAKRALEDAAETEAKDNSAKINAVTIAQKQQQLARLQKVKVAGGKVKAQMSGVVSSVQLTVGEKTMDTAAFLLADTSGGLRFTTQVSKEDAIYVDTGDTVTLKAGDRTWEDMTVLSTETEEDHTVKVTVYVPKKTISLGANASMELCKTSEEYSVTVPITAIHSEKDKYFVYTMEKADTVLGGAYVAKKTNVTIAEKNGEYAAIKDGDLSSGDAVIVDSDAILSAGENVRLQES